MHLQMWINEKERNQVPEHGDRNNFLGVTRKIVKKRLNFKPL